jgi:hypothetical protein
MVAFVRSSVDERNDRVTCPPGIGYCGLIETENGPVSPNDPPSDCAEAAPGVSRISDRNETKKR